MPGPRIALNAVIACQTYIVHRVVSLPVDDARYTQPKAKTPTELKNMAQIGKLSFLSILLRWADQKKAPSLAKDQVNRDAVC